MARRENFTAGTLVVDESLVLPVWEEANIEKLKERLTANLLRSGSNRTIDTAMLPTNAAEKAAEVRKRYLELARFELPNKGITVLGYVHGNRKTTSAAITTSQGATARLLTSIFDPRYKGSTNLVGSSDTFTGANNSAAIGLYLFSYFVDEYYPRENSAPGFWEAAKYAAVV